MSQVIQSTSGSCKFIIETPTVAQLAKEYSAFYVARNFINVY
jgi:hypothetical protein